MDAQKFSGKQWLIIVSVTVVAQVIGGLIVYHLTKPKATDPATTPPVGAKQQVTTPPVTTTPVTTTGEG